MKMAECKHRGLTDEQVEEEIRQILDSPEYKIAKKEQMIKYRRRQYLYQLRNYKKHGKELLDMGYRIDTLEEDLFGDRVTALPDGGGE